MTPPAAIPFDNSYARLGEPFGIPQQPSPVAKPTVIRINDPLAEELGINPQWLHTEGGLAALAGNSWPDGSTPIATAYAGHQFGQFNPQLGDGRAVLLGEVVDRNGKRRDLQLKGSGRTQFSRGGDGRSPLGPVLREYLVSEAMHTLGVPSTRALAAVSTGEQVIRERAEPGAILTRVAASHLRIGTFEFFAARQQFDALESLLDYTMERHYPDLIGTDEPALSLLDAVSHAMGSLVAHWQLLGFVHGVLNTDNMLLSGETVDFGPCAFMENYDPATVFSSIDHQGRYAYANQPAIAQWNLARLGEALLPLMGSDGDKAVEKATAVIRAFPQRFQDAYDRGLATKLGLAQCDEDDRKLAEALFTAMQKDSADFTLTFRFLAESAMADGGVSSAGELLPPGPALLEWLPLWKSRLARDSADSERRQRNMLTASPIFIPRNHLVQRAIREGEDGDFRFFHRLADRLLNPGTWDPQDRDLALPAAPEERVYRTFCGT